MKGKARMKIPIKATSSEIGLAIRMTPLIDVIFLLLIFFILTIRLEKPEGVLENVLPQSDTQGITEKEKDWEIVKLRIKLVQEEEQLKKKQDQALNDELANVRRIIGPNDDDVSNLPYVSLSLVAEALLALCHVHVRQQSEYNANESHPIIPLMETCRSWLDWDMERTRIKSEANKSNFTGLGESCQSNIAPCAITALCHMAILKQVSSTSTNEQLGVDSVLGSKRRAEETKLDEPTHAQFYVDIFNAQPALPDSTRAAAAQAFVCICLAANRSEGTADEPLGLLASLEFLLDGILGMSIANIRFVSTFQY